MLSAALDGTAKPFKPLKSEEITPLINTLLSMPQDDEKNNTYLQSVSNNEDTNNIYEMLKHPFIYCWITPHSIVAKTTEFKFKFNLYIDDCNDHYYNQTQSVYKYTFKTSFKDIKSIYTKAIGQRKYFPVQKFPKLLPETLSHRSDKLKEDLFILDQYTYLEDEMTSIDGSHTCTGPGKKHWWSSKLKEANDNDIITLSYILCKLFNSPSFCYMDYSFDCFMTQCGIAHEMKSIIKAKGFILLDTLRRKSLTFTVRDANNLHNQLFEDLHKTGMRFHSVTVCARPVHGVKNVSLIDHWALKFEGDKHLLTLDYYANSKVIAIVSKNNCVGQRIFWYSWCANSKQFFTSRWGTLSKIYLDHEMQGVSGACIGRVISKWKSKHSKYCSMTNNCQHFVRDILTIFSYNAAKYLSTQFHHRVVEGIIFPSLPFMDEIDEQKRMKDIRYVLYEELVMYHKRIVQQEDEDEEAIIISVIDDMKSFDDDIKIFDDDEIPDINEEEIEYEQSHLRFKQWLCDELGMHQYLELFERQNLDQTQLIQWFNIRMINNVGIKYKVHALFIAEQAQLFDIDPVQNINILHISKDRFHKWLCNEVKLEQYVVLFQQRHMDDIRQIAFFNQDTLNDIGIKPITHCKLILEKARM